MIVAVLISSVFLSNGPCSLTLSIQLFSKSLLGVTELLEPIPATVWWRCKQFFLVCCGATQPQTLMFTPCDNLNHQCCLQNSCSIVVDCGGTLISQKNMHAGGDHANSSQKELSRDSNQDLLKFVLSVLTTALLCSPTHLKSFSIILVFVFS